VDGHTTNLMCGETLERLPGRPYQQSGRHGCWRAKPGSAGRASDGLQCTGLWGRQSPRTDWQFVSRAHQRAVDRINNISVLVQCRFAALASSQRRQSVCDLPVDCICRFTGWLAGRVRLSPVVRRRGGGCRLARRCAQCQTSSVVLRGSETERSSVSRIRRSH